MQRPWGWEDLRPAKAHTVQTLRAVCHLPRFSNSQKFGALASVAQLVDVILQTERLPV